MNNEKGEATLFCILILVVLSGLLTLAGLELHRNFKLLKNRTHIILCIKETKGELNGYLTRMGQTNWALKNLTRAQLVAVFIPYLWPYIGKTEQLKKALKLYQLLQLSTFSKRLLGLQKRHCPIPAKLLLNPFMLGSSYGFSRNSEEGAKLRNKQWTYYFLRKPYLITVDVNATQLEAISPVIRYKIEEKVGMLLSPLSSH